MIVKRLRPGFHEDWFCQKSQEVLADLVREVADVPGRLVEIGAWEGRSTVAMANAAYPRVVNSVDTWEGSPGEISAVLAAERDVLAQWRFNMMHLTKGNVFAHRMGWRDYFIKDSSPVALCFIDAEHTYDEVKWNALTVLPLMSPGGVLCGDDIGHPPVREAVKELFGDDEVYVHGSLWIWREPA